MPLIRLYLVRHGETDWNLTRRVQGQLPIGLNGTGHRQAQILARFFALCPLTAVWSSDLPRALETAAPIAARHGLTVRTTPALRERDLQPFEGIHGDDVETALKTAGPGGREVSTWYEVPGVERDPELLNRLLPLLGELRGQDGEILVVTHGGPQKVILHHVLGLPHHVRHHFALDNASVLAITPERDHWRVEGFYSLPVLERLVGADHD